MAYTPKAQAAAFAILLSLGVTTGCRQQESAGTGGGRGGASETGDRSHPAGDSVPGRTPYDNTSMQADGNYRGAPDAGASGRIDIRNESGSGSPAGQNAPSGTRRGDASIPDTPDRSHMAEERPARPAGSDPREDDSLRASPKSGRAADAGSAHPAHDDSVRLNEELLGRPGSNTGGAAPTSR